jgi:secreted trypsin-like serine protease
MNQRFFIFMLTSLLISLSLFCELSVSAAVLKYIDVDWTRVKPITDYREFWKGKSIQHTSNYFKKKYENIEELVAGGNVAGRHDFPYKSALISEMPFGSALCSASLISRQAVLTAASCIDGASSSMIILGGSNLQNPSELFQARFRVQSTNYRIHPFFRQGVTNSDVGIVRFDNPIHVFTLAVNIIQLPTEDMLNDVFANQESISMGFGRTSGVAENYSYNLLYVPLTTMTNLACGLRFPGRIDTSHICTTGIQRRGFCDGEIGAPLVIERAGISFQIGIASLFPNSGCDTGEPSVFTRVTSFMAFIQQNM